MGEQQLTRHDRRARERWERAAQDRARARRRSTGLHGRAAVSSWAQERWAYLQRQSHRIGHGEMETVADRKRVVIDLNREHAERAGVTDAQWACMTSQQRNMALLGKAIADKRAEIVAAGLSLSWAQEPGPS